MTSVAKAPEARSGFDNCKCRAEADSRCPNHNKGSQEVKDPRWWKEAVVYQIYPASFKDSNGDGIGDLKGVQESLDHIQDLGADTIWISPIYQSPQVDLGYDISDYTKIHAPYGTVQDMDRLIALCHQRGMRIVMDLVVNHTSDQHAWFLESRSSRSNPKANWYHWHDGRIGPDGTRQEPNNWRSNFGGSAWEWDDVRQQYYLHLFAKEMPDLNWECQAAREAIYDDAFRFWLDKGIDGFRIDTMTIYSKPLDYPDAPITDKSEVYQPGSPVYRNHPGVYKIHSDFYDKVWSNYGDLLLVGEYGSTTDVQLASKYCRSSLNRVGMGFQFETVCTGYSMCEWDVTPWSLTDFKSTHAKWQQFIEGNDAWTSAFLENHDLGRSVSRFGSEDPRYWAASAKALAVLEATCTGTLFVYQGQEIGMLNAPDAWPIEEFKDVNTVRYWESLVKSGSPEEKLRFARRAIGKVARDNSRLPMQWSEETHAGFTTPDVTPWMRVHDNYKEINVAKQSQNSSSILSFWRRLLKLRKENAAVFTYGSFYYVGPESTSVICYVKESQQRRALVVLNMSAFTQDWVMPNIGADLTLKIANTNCVTAGVLGPYEARVYL